ncbi:MAG: ABC transporter permease [Actinomycetes bacterium]|jgi:putative ABC transport system permease protein|nr:ABC transporter permease [Actinomycetes bacterium]
MSLLDIILETARSLRANKGRSALTILGIVVGIASVIALVSIGQGTRTSIQDQIRSVGTNLVTISNMPSVDGEGLTDEDVTALRELNGVEAVTPVRSSNFDVVSGAAEYSTNASVVGCLPAYAQIRSLTVERGTFITDYSQYAGVRVAVLSDGSVTTLFGDDAVAADALGQTIRIDGVQFRVIGVLSSSGGSAVQSVSNDATIYVPLSTATVALTGSGSYDTLYVEGTSEDVMETVSDAAEMLLKSRHGYDPTGDDADFTVSSMSSLLDMADNVTGMLTALLAAIASISLIVGGIGIMNMMLTTVTERIREIGLRKAIGATPGNLTLQFLVESVVLTAIGGVIGVAVGWAAAAIINAADLVTTTVTLTPVLLAVGVCMLIGIVFGFYPARRAAKLDPIDALRYQ